MAGRPARTEPVFAIAKKRICFVLCPKGTTIIVATGRRHKSLRGSAANPFFLCVLVAELERDEDGLFTVPSTFYLAIEL